MVRIVLENLNNIGEILRELETVGVNEGYISIATNEEVTIVRPLNLNYETFVNELDGKPSSYSIKGGITVVYNDKFLPENLEHNYLATNFLRVRLKGNCIIIGEKCTKNGKEFSLLNLEEIIKIIEELALCKKNVDGI